MGRRVRVGADRRRDDEWARLREAIDLAEVVTRCLGTAPGRRGSNGGRHWWLCPFHEDRNPSFSVRPGDRRWRCFGCGKAGDAVEFVRCLNPGMTFPEIKAFIVGNGSLAIRATRRPAPPRVEPEPSISPEAWQASARELATEAERLLWEPEGGEALAHLRGRCLDDATIRAARIGFIPRQGEGIAAGIAIPWLEGSVFSMVNVRRPPGSDPKYMAMRGSRRGGIYPSRRAILPGRPLVVVEGELDALLLGQELGDLASVVTLGSAGTRPDAAILGAMLPASPWYIATDADPAGDGAAAGWPASARRVRPPAWYKDWTEARQDGVCLRRWWGDILRGVPSPELFTDEEAASWRWGPARDDPTPGILAGEPF